MIDATTLAAAYDRSFARRAPALGIREGMPEDDEFLRTLHMRCSPLATLLPPAMLEHQAASQVASHRHAFPAAMRRIATLAGLPIGHMIIDWLSPTGSYGVDLAVLPEYRATGAGLHLLRAWVSAADLQTSPARLKVVRDNPAQRIYLRLGFVPVPDDDPDDPVMTMLRPPRPQTAQDMEASARE